MIVLYADDVLIFLETPRNPGPRSSRSSCLLSFFQAYHQQTKVLDVLLDVRLSALGWADSIPVLWKELPYIRVFVIEDPKWAWERNVHPHQKQVTCDLGF
ncbi:hypothetical protein NDU88_008537 [Pleurodeles waltl]|uniref:Reverse transcriptase domain-containing protein n=1 Tax=Pleurodeles waltl TaxID=8319 RepID=A0AAV7N5A3_PLEWA|nr:hypothetical protein NDU88_008537 [Pleurodeles waltl]